MERCKKVTISLTDQYTKDERIGEINVKALEVKKQAGLFQAALATVIREATGDS